MTEAQAAPRKPSTNKNIQKLRAISMVCGLTRSWQHWVTENEDKQSNEPTGWAPAFVIRPAEEPKKPSDGTKTPWSERKKKTHSQPGQPTAVSLNQTRTPTPPPPTPAQEANDAPPLDVALLVESRIETELVVKTATTGEVQEKDAAVLTERITKETLPLADMDEMLSEQSPPPCHRKCSDAVSPLTRSPGSVEEEQKLATEGGGQGERRTCSVDTEDSGYSEVEGRALETEGGHSEDSGYSEVERRALEMEGGQADGAEPGRGAEDTGPPEENSEVAVKIKRPSVSTYKKVSEDANKINLLSKKYSPVGDLKSRWQSWASDHTVTQRLNPFSELFDHDYSMSLRLHRGEEGYGRPKEGTKTAERAQRAERHIHGEISDMCYVIRTMADPDGDGKTRVTFAELFDRYVRISDKVVGILLRARKHGKVAFEGEMLWQGQDDAVVITLLV